MDNPSDFDIRLIGDPVLRKKADPVELIDSKIQQLIQGMAAAMYEAIGVGLAAPQIGVLKRVVVIDVGEGLVGLINPEIVAREGGEEVGVEGCLSVPGIVGDVPRSMKVKVQALNAHGEKMEIEGEGLLARALQHELDHLDGVLFVDRARNLRPAQTQQE